MCVCACVFMIIMISITNNNIYNTIDVDSYLYYNEYK